MALVLGRSGKSRWAISPCNLRASTATISYASPTQLNYRVPETVATGLATVTIAANGSSIPGALNIVAAYPNLFQVNGEGLAAALVVRVRNGQQSYEPVYRVGAGGAIEAVPIDVSVAGEQVYLILFGTGLGKTGGNPAVSATIGGASSAVGFAGAQGQFGGLDQYNLLLPASLAGRGKVETIVTAGGKASNPVNITIK